VQLSEKFTFSSGLNAATTLRALEAFQPPDMRIYDASFDYSILPLFWRGLMLPGIRHVLVYLLQRSAMGTSGMLLCRTRFIDEALILALQAHCQQVVCMGAGYDTRAYRISGIETARVFELDLPISQQLKRNHFQKVLGSLPKHVTFVPIDFNRQSISLELPAAGFDSDHKAFFIWEGVTQYITAEAVDDTLKFVSGSAPGSQVAFTYIERGIVDGSARSADDQRIMSRVERRGMPWIFGLESSELDAWLARRGLKLSDQADASEYCKRYVSPIGRQMQIYAGEKMALAEIAN
jgi:methyltransferase (TIGR00027 family)